MKVFLDACYVICPDLLKKLFANVAVLNEVVWILKKYGVDLKEIFDFLDGFTDLDLEDYVNMKEFMLRYNLKPSDALHVSSMKKDGIKTVVSESGMDKKSLDRL